MHLPRPVGLLRFVARALVAGLFLLPLLWMIVAALHPPGVSLPRTLHLLPEGVSLGNFGRVSALIPLGSYMANSLVVVALALPITVVTASWAGFAIAQLPPSSQRRWILISLALLMVPSMALWLPRFLIYRPLGWIDSPLALIAPAWMGTSPFFVLMYYRAFRRIPRAIYDVARLDGAGVLQSWARVAMPLVQPTSWAVALLSFVLYWGDFVSPLLYLRSTRRYTLPVALRLLQQLSRADWALVMAAAAIATAVPLLLFTLFQLYLVARRSVPDGA